MVELDSNTEMELRQRPQRLKDKVAIIDCNFESMWTDPFEKGKLFNAIAELERRAGIVWPSTAG